MIGRGEVKLCINLFQWGVLTVGSAEQIFKQPFDKNLINDTERCYLIKFEWEKET